MARRRLSDRENVFILVWSGTDPQELWVDGATFFVPGRDEIAHASTPERPTKYRYPAAETRAGVKLPGTIQVRDVYGMQDGNRIRTFEAYELVKFIETSRKDLMERGLDIVESPEDVAEAIKLGIPAFEASLDERAQTVLQNELTRRKKWDDKGVPAPISSSDADVQWALIHLETRRTLQQSKVATDDIKAALGGIPAAATVRRPTRRLTEDDDDLYARARSLSVKLQAKHLNGLLEKDPEVEQEVRGLIDARLKYLQSASRGEVTEPAPEAPAGV